MGIWTWIIGVGGLLLLLIGKHFAHINQQEINELQKLNKYGDNSKKIQEIESAIDRCAVLMFIGGFLMCFPLVALLAKLGIL